MPLRTPCLTCFALLQLFLRTNSRTAPCTVSQLRLPFAPSSVCTTNCNNLCNQLRFPYDLHYDLQFPTQLRSPTLSTGPWVWTLGSNYIRPVPGGNKELVKPFFPNHAIFLCPLLVELKCLSDAWYSGSRESVCVGNLHVRGKRFLITKLQHPHSTPYQPDCCQTPQSGPGPHG